MESDSLTKNSQSRCFPDGPRTRQVNGVTIAAAALGTLGALWLGDAALALATIHGHSIGGVELARLCQRAENEFVGARCGIMDQFIAIHAVAGHALLLDCRSLAFEPVPLASGISLVICNTMVKHAIAGGEYNERRAQCEEGVRRLRQRLP